MAQTVSRLVSLLYLRPIACWSVLDSTMTLRKVRLTRCSLKSSRGVLERFLRMFSSSSGIAQTFAADDTTSSAGTASAKCSRVNVKKATYVAHQWPYRRQTAATCYELRAAYVGRFDVQMQTC